MPRAAQALLGVIVTAVGMTSAAAQDPPSTYPDVGVLRAEVQAARALYCPATSVRLRFTLLNTSDEPITIPLAQPVPAGEGVGLPLELILGTPEHPLLSIAHEDGEMKEITPPSSTPPSTVDGARMIRLGARAALGREIDLRDYHSSVRYVGGYRLEWRPLEGRLGTLATQFRIEPRKDAILVTDQGKLTFALDYEQSPLNVENFLELVRDKFYDGKTIHRIIPGYILQGGCPKGDGTGTRPDGRLVPAELHNTEVKAGTLLMAHKRNNPDTASCQFFIALARLSELDGQYTVIGQAADEESLRTLQKLAELPTDKRDRPLTPLYIRSVNLVDAEDARTRSVELRVPTKLSPASGSEGDPER